MLRLVSALPKKDPRRRAESSKRQPIISQSESDCLFDLRIFSFERNYRAWSRDKRKGRKTLTLTGRLENVFSGRQLGLVQEETLVVFCTRMPWETVRTTREWSGGRKKFSPGASILFNTESEETDWRKSLNSVKASPATRAKTPCLWGAKCKRSSCDYRHPPVCRNYKSGNRCIHGDNCLYRHAGWTPETQKIVCLLWIRELQCTCWAREIQAQMKWILYEGPETL